MSANTRRVLAFRDANFAIVGWAIPEIAGSEPPSAVPAHSLEAHVRFDYHHELPDLSWAAQRWLEAISTIDVALRQAGPDIVFNEAFGRVSTADLRYELDRTWFEISNQKDFGNNGVGGAARGAEGKWNIDRLGRAGVEGYHRAVSRNRGVVAQALHEQAHMTAAGFAFFDQSHHYDRKYKDKFGLKQSFYAGPFALNLECYANDIMISAADALGLDLGRVIPGGATVGTGPRDARPPEDIYRELVGG